jgi:hypothetical protein
VKGPEVLIDGVLYVPISEATPSYDQWMDALIEQWGGDDWRKLFADAPTYLRVVVSDTFEEGEGDTLQEFIARILREP